MYFSLGATCDRCHLTYRADGSDDESRWFATCNGSTNHINWACVAPCAQTEGCDIYSKSNGDIKVNQEASWCESIDGCSKNFCDHTDYLKEAETAGKVYTDIKNAADGVMSCASSAEGDVDDFWDCFKTMADVIEDIGYLFSGGKRATAPVDCRTPFAGLEEALEGSTFPELSDYGLGAWLLANLEAGEIAANNFALSCDSCEWSIAYADDLSETPAKLNASCKDESGKSKNVHIDMNCLYSCALTPDCFVINDNGDLKVDPSHTIENAGWFDANYCSKNFKF